MVLESLFPARKIENKPVDMLILAFIVAIACIFIAYLVFPAYAGIIAPLLVAVAVAPLVYRIFTIEEEIEREQAEGIIKQTFWDRHDETIKIFTMFFIGNVLAVLLMASLLPDSFIGAAFGQQINEINAIRSLGTGAAIAPGLVELIIMNNLKVMAFAFFLSFIIGTGAIFILSWNASVLGVYLASFIRKGLYTSFLLQTSGIIPHAIIEIGAYFLAGIAGGILSAGVIREKLKSKEFRLVLRDSFLLMAIAVLAVVLGAYIEVGL
ncbi:MAG: stage II sporulation protein M [Candidatus Aenigmatarchaeota archaeon]